MRQILLLCFFSCIIFNTILLAQRSTDGLWNDVAESSIPLGKIQDIVPVSYRTLFLNLDALASILSRAPTERTVDLRTSRVVIQLPLPDGSFQKFRIVESPIMEPELSAKYPEIRTYLGQGIDDRTAAVRFDITPAGFHGMILSGGPTVYIDPYSRSDAQHYICYYAKDIHFDPTKHTFEEIGVVDPNGEMGREISRLVATGPVVAIGESLRTYRLACAATGEYTIFHGGTVPQGMAAIVTAMNRVNGVYEREVAVRMLLIANNDTLIYTNPSTDPYTNSNGGAMLGQNQSNLDAVIGNANYDIGHVFSTGGGGVAGLGVVCRSGVKAWGVTGLPSPIGDPFYIDYVAHEMGHQFGGNHTFNGNAGSCSGGNRNGPTAYEPGSGSTIMAYAGICGGHDIQSFSDDYFHLVSIDEIVAYTTIGSGNGCPVITVTGNNAPTVNIPVGGITLPIGTPFSITGSAVDPDSDVVTFTWEQFDLGPAGHPNSPSGNAPIFRSFPGTTNPTRIFPRVSDLINNTQTIGEILPSYSRTLTFRLTVRDNRAGGGGVGRSSTVTYSVTNTAGPFVVSLPNTGGTWLRNSTDTVKWDVANTNNPPINCTNVNILLSMDGGTSYPITLAANTPNDGIEAVTVPDTLTESARVKVEAVGSVFFDISNRSFAIATVTAPMLHSPLSGSEGLPVPVSVVWRTVIGATNYHVQLSTSPTFTTLVVNDSTTDTSRSVSGLAYNTVYYWRVRSRNADGYSGWSDTWLFRTYLAPPALLSPPNNAVNQPTTVTFQWGIVGGAAGFRLEVSGDSTFIATVVDDTLGLVYQRTVIVAPATRYYWRVRGRNAGGFGAVSVIRNFTTASVPPQVVLIAPPHGATLNPDSVLFQWWRPDTSTQLFWLQLSTDSLFVNSTVDSTLTDTTHTVYSLLGNQTYWWKVRAWNNAGWGSFSVARKFTTTLTGVAERKGVPGAFALLQNYPNPFNPTTTIEFALPRESHVTLGIFNLLGERVAVLVDGRKSAGYYTVTFDGRGLASGLYFFSLRSGEFEQTRKLLLLK